jgi:hypothetical protein
MGLDIRWPIGLMFTLIGVMLAVFGLVKSSESVSLGININLICAFMLIGAIRGKKNPPSA